MDELPYNLYRADQVREMDRLAIEQEGIPGPTLMERAGAAVFNALRTRVADVRRLVVVCGLGNNGGDGYVVARLAHEAGMAVTVMQLGEHGKVHGDARAARERLQAAGVAPYPFKPEGLTEADAVIDAVFGTGLDRDVEGLWREAIDAVNHAGVPVVAVDIPSGLHADTGRVLGIAVQAQVTVTFIGAKRGLFTGDAPAYCGTVLFDDLDVPPEPLAGVRPSAFRLTYSGMNRLLGPRSRTAHKGHFGHVLIIGGECGMSGAPRLAGEAALRTGAGLVSVATRAEHAALIGAGRPELMCHGAEDGGAVRHLLQRATAVAIGPGLGQGEWGRTMLKVILEIPLPLVVDADALNLIAGDPFKRDNWVLTPHPGEAARLLGCTTPEVQADRFAAVTGLRRRYGGIVVLKGAGTLIFDDSGPVEICAGGNPGMASGGMGDALTGVIVGLIAQGLSLMDAARLGVCLHAKAGDRAARRDGERGLIVSDLIAALHGLVNPPVQ